MITYYWTYIKYMSDITINRLPGMTMEHYFTSYSYFDISSLTDVLETSQ